MELTKKIKLALDETRILILGAQILLGFQFRAVFSDGYEELPAALRYLDGFAILPMICVVALLITPGPYHRIVENGEDSRSFHGLVTTIANLALVPFAIALGLDVVVYRVGSALVTAATIPLALGLAGDTSVVMLKITPSPAIAIAAAVATFILLIGLWQVYPMVTAARRTHRGLGNQSDALV